MKRIILMSLAICFAVIGFGQQTAKSDQQATSILDNVKKQYSSYKTIYAAFTLTIEIPEEDVEIQKGHLSQMGDKYTLDMEGQNIISDGTTLWVHLKKNNEVQINDVPEESDDDEILSPKDLFRIYEKENYKYALAGESFKNGMAIQEIEFVPNDRDSEYFKLKLTIEKKSASIKSIKVFSKDGSRYTLTINQMTPNKAFGNSHFKFDASKFPGIHVEDLRI